MQKLILGSVIAGACALAGAAQADETRNYDFDKFKAIDIAAGVSAEITVGEAQSIRVETEKGDFEDLVIRVEDGTLYVKRDWKGGWGRKKSNYKVFATVVTLNDIEASSGSSVSAKGIAEDDFSIDVSSGASVSVEGTCDTVDAEASSGASVNARDLVCKAADADASSGASLSVHASEEVDADASSGASVTVYGGPEKVNTDKSSGGSVRIRD